ncbi:MAG: hypothetical protein CVU93_01175, partial [Firmicutes bacterium HGW-Firmicutes-18]
NISAPVLFIHGEKDDFIPAWMVEELAAEKNKGPKEIYVAENAGHAKSYWTDPKKYEDVVIKFLQSNSII